MAPLKEDPTREEIAGILRTSLRRRIENWLWRGAIAMFMIYAFTPTAPSETVLRIEVTEDIARSQHLQDRIVAAASGDVAAVVFEIDDLRIDAAQSERLQRVVRRIAEIRPTAAAIAGDLGIETLAAFRPAHRVVGEATAFLTPVLADVREARLTEVAAVQMVDAAPDHGLAPARHAARVAWLLHSLEAGAPRAVGLLARAQAGKLVSGIEAAQVGLIDAVGSASSARDWAADQVRAHFNGEIAFRRHQPVGR